MIRASGLAASLNGVQRCLPRSRSSIAPSSRTRMSMRDGRNGCQSGDRRFSHRQGSRRPHDRRRIGAERACGRSSATATSSPRVTPSTRRRAKPSKARLRWSCCARRRRSRATIVDLELRHLQIAASRAPRHSGHRRRQSGRPAGRVFSGGAALPDRSGRIARYRDRGRPGGGSARPCRRSPAGARQGSGPAAWGSAPTTSSAAPNARASEASAFATASSAAVAVLLVAIAGHRLDCLGQEQGCASARRG